MTYFSSKTKTLRGSSGLFWLGTEAKLSGKNDSFLKLSSVEVDNEYKWRHSWGVHGESESKCAQE